MIDAILAPELESPYLVDALRQVAPILSSGAHETEIFAVPDANSVLISAGGVFESLLALRPGARIYALSGITDQAAGIAVQIVDRGTGAQLHTARVIVDTSTTDADLESVTPQQLLPRPMLPSGGLVSVKVYNLSDSPANVQVCVFCASPRTKE